MLPTNAAPPTAAAQPSAAPTEIVRLQDVTLSFGEDAGVFDVSMSIPQGAIMGLIGPSGCGKTTTVRLMLGLYKPQQGAIRVFGREPSHFTVRDRERIGYLPQQFVLYPNLTATENLRFVSSLYGISYIARRPRIRDLLDFVELTQARNTLGAKLSGGMKRRLSLACALVHDPQMLVADEPTAGIDPVLRGKFWEYFRKLRDEGRTLLITTQYVGEAAYCDYVGVMREGKLLMIETPTGLRRKVLGGEVIKLTVDRRTVHQAAHLLQSHQLVRLVRQARDEPGVLYLTVDDAGQALPVLLRTIDDHPELAVQHAEEYQPPFDDIFVRLMQQAERANA